jgi:hypothetical protein
MGAVGFWFWGSIDLDEEVGVSWKTVGLTPYFPEDRLMFVDLNP